VQRLAVDLVGPNPRTARGNVFILTALDTFTRYLIAVPLRNKTAPVVAAALIRHVFAVFGLAREIYSDRGGEFCNRVLQTICQEYGIRHLKTSAERPSANGRCERVHRGMHAMLSKVIRSDQKDWDLVLPVTTFAYNSTIHSSTGFSPCELMTGRRPIQPSDLRLGQLTVKSKLNAADYLDRMHRRLRQHFRQAARRSAEQAARRKITYDRSVRKVSFLPGQTVLVRRDHTKPNLNQKWRRLYDGPFTVERPVGPVNYLVCRIRDGRELIAHVDRMRLTTLTAFSRQQRDELKVTDGSQ
jgi:hypothetical protein